MLCFVQSVHRRVLNLPSPGFLLRHLTRAKEVEAQPSALLVGLKIDSCFDPEKKVRSAKKCYFAGDVILHPFGLQCAQEAGRSYNWKL